MDYSNFVRNFYRSSLNRLKGFKQYYGSFVNVLRPLDINKENLHLEETNSLFLPSYSLNINAPTKEFINFMDYYVTLMPDLGVVFANEQRINDLYNNAVDMNIIEDDERTMNYIELIIDVGIKTLETEGILEK